MTIIWKLTHLEQNKLLYKFAPQTQCLFQILQVFCHDLFFCWQQFWAVSRMSCNIPEGTTSVLKSAQKQYLARSILIQSNFSQNGREIGVRVRIVGYQGALWRGASIPDFCNIPPRHHRGNKFVLGESMLPG